MRADLTAVGLAAVLFVVYVLGACATIYVGDSGELVTAVHVLGIPHPSGYPLYVLVGKLWTLLLPVGSIAWRMSVFSAACAAAACGMLYALGRRLGLARMPAALAALLLGFAPSFWGEANVQRTYTLGALFVVLATSAAWRWHGRPDGRGLAVAFFACGLGATNHTFMAVYALALAAHVLLVRPAVARDVRAVSGAALAFALGLLLYAYLPLRSRADPPLDWGNPETLRAFLAVVSRKSFWQRAWITTPADALPIVADYLRSFVTELTPGGAGLAVLGLAAARRHGWPLSLMLLVMLGNLAALAVHGSRSDLFIWHRYYIPSYAMAALLAGLGGQVLATRLPRVLRVLPLALPLWLLVVGWPQFDRSRYRVAESFSQAVLASLPPGAHLIASDDNILFALIYLHFVEGRRPDVDLVPEGVAGIPLPPLRFDPDTDPLFLTHHPNWRVPTLEVVPVGLVFQARRSGEPLPRPVIPLGALDGEDDPRVPKDYLTQNLIGHFHFMLGVTFEDRDWLRARREFAAAAAAAPDNDVLFYNLGLIFRRNGLLDTALAAFERSDAINPRALASAQRVRASDQVAAVRAEQARLAPLEAELARNPELAALPPGGPAWHERLAELLDARGEPAAARGHRLGALDAGPARR